jgi:hypothetical protein
MQKSQLGFSIASILCFLGFCQSAAAVSGGGAAAAPNSNLRIVQVLEGREPWNSVLNVLAPYAITDNLVEDEDDDAEYTIYRVGGVRAFGFPLSSLGSKNLILRLRIYYEINTPMETVYRKIIQSMRKSSCDQLDEFRRYCGIRLKNGAIMNIDSINSNKTKVEIVFGR